MSTPAGATTEATRQGPVQNYDPQHLVGGLLEEEEPVPLLYFTSFMEAWVTASTSSACLLAMLPLASALSLSNSFLVVTEMDNELVHPWARHVPGGVLHLLHRKWLLFPASAFCVSVLSLTGEIGPPADKLCFVQGNIQSFFPYEYPSCWKSYT